MSLVPHKKNSQNGQVTLKDLIEDRLPALGIESIIPPQGLKRVLVRPHVKCRRRIVFSHPAEDAMVIFSPEAQEKLVKMSQPMRRAFMDHLVLCRTALVVFAQTTTWPTSLTSLLRHCSIPAAVSFLHENLLESRLKAIIQEKIKKCVTVHGTAMEVQGRGVLVRGASGIGKTTALLQAISEGYLWIADDRVEITKNAGKLFVSGHRKIKDYFHTDETGIMPVDRMIKASRIRKKAELAYVIDVTRTPQSGNACRFDETEIMDIRLPLLQMNIPRTGYFDKNLLSEAVQKVREVA